MGIEFTLSKTLPFSEKGDSASQLIFVERAILGFLLSPANTKMMKCYGLDQGRLGTGVMDRKQTVGVSALGSRLVGGRA